MLLSFLFSNHLSSQDCWGAFSKRQSTPWRGCQSVMWLQTAHKNLRMPLFFFPSCITLRRGNICYCILSLQLEPLLFPSPALCFFNKFPLSSLVFFLCLPLQSVKITTHSYVLWILTLKSLFFCWSRIESAVIQ